jgi:non-ribosomal peptide synthetase-like protein
VRGLIRSAPPAAFPGTPIYNVYLRLLGARIGRNVVLRPRFLPVATDLISVGDDTTLLKDSILLGYKAQSNRIHLAPIAIGANAFVGEGCVIDIGTTMEDDAQLGHASSLQTGQKLQRGRRYNGSPAQETSADYRRVEPMRCTTLRRSVYALAQLAIPFLVVLPLLILALYLLVPYAAQETLAHLEGVGIDGAQALPVLELAILSLVFFLGTLMLGLAAVAIVPRLLRPFLPEDKTYVLFGLHYFIHRVVSVSSNSTLYNTVFGDSSAIVHYLRLVGYRLNTIIQTGSNFGSTQKHENPFMVDIGTGTMVSDGLSLMNAQYSSTSFKLSEVAVAGQNYLGNDIRIPPGHRVGKNCLLATKVMVPIDGPVRENVGLLGAPPFEIPRAVDRDRLQMQTLSEETRAAQIKKKNVHNFLTMATYLSALWVFSFLMLLGAVVAITSYRTHGVAALFAFSTGALVSTIGYFALFERVSIGFRRLAPKIVSIYDPQFWSHERYWKFAYTPLQTLFKGTPMRPLVWRLLGMKVGAKLFDDGCAGFETSMIEVGDHVTLNEAATMQGHSLEEGLFKSDRIRIGNGCTIGTGAMVHYGVSMGDDVLIDPDSFLM